jgi:outer membrane receptor protein involved in Fe transport
VEGQSQGLRTDIDRRSYDITKDLQTQSGSIADALRNIPSVQVDVQGNLSLRGDPNVTIMIDGKPSSLFKGPARGQILQQLPAGSFERVEVLTNPSAAYRPDGSGGIINLIPKKARRMGRTGSLRANLSSGDKESIGLNLSAVGKTLTFTGDATYAHEDQTATIQDRRSSLDPVSGRFLDSAQDYASSTKVNVGFGRAAFDYDPDAKTRVSGEVRGTALDLRTRDVTAFTGQAPGGLAEGFDRQGAAHLQHQTVAANGGWRRKFGSEPDHELVVDLTEERTTDSRDRADTVVSRTAVLPSFSEAFQVEQTQDQTHLKVDYTLPLAENAKLKTGYELEYDRDVFDNAGDRGPVGGPLAPDPTLTDTFKFDQAINGVYATYQRPFGDLTVLGGVRVEDTRIDLRDAAFRGSNDDTRAYPSLHVTYKFSDAQQVTASYSERIVRPQPTDYNPFRIYVDPFNYRAGNPGLKPQETHSYELAWQYRKGLTYYLATFYWRQNDRGVTDVVRDLGGGVLLTTKENLANSRNGGLEFVASGRLTSKLTYQVSGDAFWNEIDAAGLGFLGKRSGWTLSGRGSLNWQVTPNDLVQVIGNLTGKRLTPQGYYEPWGLLNLGYRHKVNNDWSLFVTGRDLLGSLKSSLVIDTPTLKDRSETRPKLRAVFVGFTYSFGAGPRRDPGIDYGGGAGGAPR